MVEKYVQKNLCYLDAAQWKTELLNRYTAVSHCLESLIKTAGSDGILTEKMFRRIRKVLKTIVSVTRMVEAVPVTRRLFHLHQSLLKAFNDQLGNFFAS